MDPEPQPAPNAAEGAALSFDESRLQDRTIRALMKVADDLYVGHEEAGLLSATLEHLLEALGAAEGVVFVAGAGDEMEPRARHGVADEDLPAAHALAATTVQEGRAQLRVKPDGGWSAGAPLMCRSACMGAVVVRQPPPGGEAPGLPLLQAVGKQIGAGLENARLYAELRATSRRAEVVNRLVATLSAGMELKGVMAPFAAELAGIEPFDRLACGFVNEAGDYIELTTHPAETAWGFGTVLPVVGSGPGAVVLNDRAVVQPDLVHQHRFIEDLKLLDEGIRSYVLLPLNARGRSVGVLALGSSRRSAFDQTSPARLQPVVDAVAVALENMRLLQKTRELSITDEVTPLFNFRFFHQMLDRELKLVDRYHSVLSLLFLDLDRFKPINDQYGHLRGSRVLREVGFLLRSAVRETDYPARYGGDEFVVILPQTDGPSALRLRDKLRQLIETHVFLQEEGINARIGVSMGVASYPTEARTKEALVRLADERMYEDKKKHDR